MHVLERERERVCVGVRERERVCVMHIYVYYDTSVCDACQQYHAAPHHDT
jgi:hypothetical protein